ncbi:MAG: hypothetical protein ACYTEK_07650 [Planctomycetota bacterium]
MAEHEKSDTSLERTQGGPEPCCASASGEADYPHQAKQIVAQPAQKVPNTLRP